MFRRIVWGLFVLATAATTFAADRPNILLFITDDESYLERSAYGWSPLPTPGFDRVAEAGVLMTNGYSSAPSCAPARASLLTGRNFWELQQGAFIQAWLPREFPVFTDLLKEQGYAVGRSGKVWGPGVYPERGHGPDVSGGVVTRKNMPQRVPQISPLDYAGHLEVFLEKQRQSGQPFFFWAGITEPHGPWDAQNYQRLEREFGITLDQIPVPEFAEDTPAMRKKRANMLYEICYADLHLQRMLKHLEDLGELENTMVIVTSDNGTSISSSDNQQKGKASPYDWGTHVPMAVMWPGTIPAQRTVTDFVSFADLAPTMLEAAGVSIPESFSGRSFLASLKSDQSGRIDSSRDAILTGLEWHGEKDPESYTFRTLRDDHFAYIQRYDNSAHEQQADGQGRPIPARSVELYDLKTDPWQLQNLAGQAAYAQQLEHYQTKLQSLGQATQDPRMTGEMEVFRQMRKFVQARKQAGYPKGEEAMKLLQKISN